MTITVVNIDSRADSAAVPGAHSGAGASDKAGMSADQTATLALRALTVVDATGADVTTFLQGQFSNDLAVVSAQQACLAGFCSPKGRLLALPIVLPLPEGNLRLLLPDALVEGFLQRLRMFVMRADVSFAVRDDLGCLGLFAADDDTVTRVHGLSPLPLDAPAERLEVASAPGDASDTQVLRWHDAPPVEEHAPSMRRYFVVAPRALIDDADLADGDAAWRLADIAAGLPRIGVETRESFVPQMVNLQLVGGLSFRKGCYPGQEIVARMQYLGKLKRHMRRFRLPAGTTASQRTGVAQWLGASADVDPALKPGASLTAGENAEAAVIVDAITGPSGTDVLAVVRIASDLDQLAVDGQLLEALPLPYSLGEAPTEAPRDRVAEQGT